MEAAISSNYRQCLEHAIYFLGEPDGEKERQLQCALRPELEAAEEVDKAYLARVAYASSDQNYLALCLRCLSVPPSLLENCSRIFTELFGEVQTLDVVPIKAAQEMELIKVCWPFFVRHAQ